MAYCAGCGTELADGVTSCPTCGRPVQTYAPPRRTEGTAIASLILGIAGLMVCPLIPSILAIIFGQQARERLRTDPTLEGDALARAGIILGWVGVGIVGLGLLVALAALLPLGLL